MHHVMSALLVLSAIVFATCSRSLGQTNVTAGTVPETKAKIATLAANSDCAKHNWSERGVAPVGFIKGVALSYAKAYREVKAGKDTAASFTAGEMINAKQDALALYGKAGGSKFDRLRASYALAIGEGMRESSGNTTEGYDKTVKQQTAEIAEAGLYQVSHDSIRGSPWLTKLYEQFKGDTAACLRAEYMEGVKDLKRDVVGNGPSADFQRFTQSCPAFATAYAVVMFRTNLKHFGPIKSKKAELLPACEAMLQAVEKEVDTTHP